MKTVKVWALRLLGFIFLGAASLQWVSYNMPGPDGSDPSPIAMVLGWLWTALIASPGLLLLKYSSPRHDK